MVTSRTVRPPSAGKIANAALLVLLAFVTVFPLYNLLVVSLTGPRAIAAAHGLSLLPRDPTLATYAALLGAPKVAGSLANSLFITAAGVLVNMALTCLAAYALSKPRLPGRRILMIAILVTMVFEGGLVPDYMLMRSLRLINRYASVILYKAVNAYYLIIMIRFFEEVPPSLLEAARIDGATETAILRRIVLPASKAGVATVSLFYTVFHWNEYFRAMIYLPDSSRWPLQVVLRELVVASEKASFIGSSSYLNFTGASQIELKSLKAGLIILAVAPVLALYPLILRFFAKGALSGAVKE